MKRFLLTAILGLSCFLVKAQSMTINNTSGCTVTFYVYASAPGCGAGQATSTYTIVPGGTIFWPNFAAVSWAVTPPAPGSQWTFIKEWNTCGVMSWTPPACGQNVCAVGIPCSTLPISACMFINTTCNTCTAIKTQWFPLGGGNVAVRIW